MIVFELLAYTSTPRLDNKIYIITHTPATVYFNVSECVCGDGGDGACGTLSLSFARAVFECVCVRCVVCAIAQHDTALLGLKPLAVAAAARRSCRHLCSGAELPQHAQVVRPGAISEQCSATWVSASRFCQKSASFGEAWNALNDSFTNPSVLSTGIYQASAD